MARSNMVPREKLEAKQRRIEELEARDQRWREALDEVLGEHRPYGDEEIFRVGWSSHEKSFYCTVCRTPWPCRIFNQLRRIFGVAHEWEADTIPYAPLKVAPVKQETEE